MIDTFFIGTTEFFIEGAKEVQDSIDAFLTMAHLNDKKIDLSHKETKTMMMISNNDEKYEFVLFISPVSKRISFGWLDLDSTVTGYHCLYQVGGEYGRVTKEDVQNMINLFYNAI